MSKEEDKIKHSKRLQNDETVVTKQSKIAKQHRKHDYKMPSEDEPHRYAKHHAADHTNHPTHHKHELTVQEKRAMQDPDLEGERDRHSNGFPKK